MLSQIKMKNNDSFFKKVFWVGALSIIIIFPILSFDYGITVDERVHHESGELNLLYFQGKDSTAIQSPFDENGEWHGNWLEDKKALNMYGSFFDLICVSTYQYFIPDYIGEYEFRHIVGSVFGAIMMIFIGLIAYLITSNWNVAFLALLFSVFTPRLLGHSMNNPKDLPLAAMITIAMYFMLRFLNCFPKLNYKYAIITGFSIGAATAFRAGGLILIPFLFVGAFIFGFNFILTREIKIGNRINNLLKITISVLIISVLGYFSCAIVWPYAQTYPLTAPYDSLKFFSDVASFNSYELFEGDWINYWEIPWYFIPKWFAITFPIHLLLGLILSPLYFIYRKRFTPLNNKMILLIVFCALFPIVYVIINKSNVYDDGRHLLFTVPFFIVISSICIYQVTTLFKKKKHKVVSFALLGLIILQPALWMVNNHPYQVLYFNPLIGGGEGAFKNYVVDFSGYSIKEACEWMEKNLSLKDNNEKQRVRMYYGDQLQLKYYLDKTTNLTHVIAHPNSSNWDYSLVFPVESKFNKSLIKNWPPKGTIHQIKTDGAPLCAIVKNSIDETNMTIKEKEKLALQSQNVSELINLSLIWFNQQNFNQGIILLKQALSIDSLNATIFNNLCYAYNELGMFNEAELYGESAIKLDPNFDLAKGNLNYALDKIEIKNTEGYTEQDYLNFSFNCHVQENFKDCIIYAKKALELNSNSLIAFNNICSANNALGNYCEAIQACNKALEIDSDYILAKNNLIVAQKGCK